MKRPVRSLFRRSTLPVVAAVAIAVLLMTPGRAAPAISVGMSLAGETLYGATTSGSIDVSNSSGENGFNVSYTLTTPPGISLTGSDIPPTSQYDDGAGSITYFFANYSDMPDGASTSFGFTVSHDTATWVVGETFSVDVAAYASADPRFVPDFDDSTGTVTGDFDTSGTASASSTIIPFEVSKSIAAPEGELLRGVHDHQTTATITITNAPAGPTNDLVIEDYLDAGFEFLSCGGTDNSTVITEEYPGAPSIVVPPVPGCVTPTSVDTVVDPAGFPAGVYTHVVWDVATLSRDLSPGEAYSITYALAIPLRENTAAWPGTPPDPAAGLQAINLDNNTGAYTTESGTEQSFANSAAVTGTWAGPIEPPGADPVFTVEDSASVVAEDLRIEKSVDVGISEIGTVSTWTIDVQTSEYVSDVTGLVVTDIVPDGLCPGGQVPAPIECSSPGPTPAYAQPPIANANGTWSLEWVLGDLGANDSTSITYTTTHRTQFLDGSGAIAIGESWTNQAAISGTTTTEDGTREVGDESQASQTAPRLSFDKQVAIPPAGTACGDGTGLDWGVADPTVTPGDRVCWRITVTGPDVRAINVKITDYLPLGFAYESAIQGPLDTIPTAPINEVDFDDSGNPLIWTLGGADQVLAPGSVFQWVISTIAEDPNANEIGDLVGNLLKISSENNQSGFFFDRDDIDVVWGKPELTLTKTVDGADADTPGTAVTAPGATALTYEVTIENVGSIEAIDVDVRDVLPGWPPVPANSCALVSAISDGGACTAGRVDWLDVGPIPAGGSITLSYVTTVPTAVSPGDVFRNDAGVVRYEAATTVGGSDQFVYIPENNIDPGAGTPNAPAADDPAHVIPPGIDLTKTSTTGITDVGNDPTDEATPGETVNFEVTATIPANTTLYDAALIDYLVDGFEFVSVTDALLDGGPLPPGFTLETDTDGNTVEGDISIAFPSIFTVGTSDSTLVLRIEATLADHPSVRRAGGDIPNQAILAWENSQGGNEELTATTLISPVEPSIRLAKSTDDADGIVLPGQVTTYTLTARNRNETDTTVAHDTVVTDVLPTFLTCADITAITPEQGSASCAAGTITWDIGTLLPGTRVDLTYQATFPDPIVGGTQFTNEAEMRTTSLPGPDPGERTSASDCGGGAESCTDYIDPASETLTAPGNVITKLVRGPGEVVPGPSTTQTIGEPIEFFVTVLVPADVQTFDTIIIDRLPPGIRPATDTGYTTGTSCTAPTLPCNITIRELPRTGNRVGWALENSAGPIEPLAQSPEPRLIDIRFEAVVLDTPDNVDGVVRTNRVEAAANTGDALPPFTDVPPPGGFEVRSEIATADVVIAEPDITITKTVLDGGSPVDARRAIEGETLVYQIDLRNDGSWPAYGIDVDDVITIPSGQTMTYVGTVPTAGLAVVDSDPSDGTLAWFVDPAGGIDPGQTFTITYSLQVWNPATTADEDPTGPEISNTASPTRYIGVPLSDFDAANREYSGGSDSVEIELDLATLGDFVWFDVNGDGVAQPGIEPPIAGVDLMIEYLDGSLETPDNDDTTDGGLLANYLFDDLPGGNHRVTVDPLTLPPWATPSYDLDGIGTPNVWTGTLAEDGDRRDVDFGYTGTGTLGDTVFWDMDGDGIQDADEPGLPGIRIDAVWEGFDGDISASPDNIDYATTTDANGEWLLENLPGGTFQIGVETADLPAGAVNTADPDGGFDSTAFVTLGNGATNLDQDFGYRGEGELGDLIWLDLDRSGTPPPPDAGEPGIPGADIDLIWYGGDGTPGGGDDVTFTRTTDADGLWLAPGLFGGSYQATVDTTSLPGGVDLTYDRDALDGTTIATLADATDTDYTLDWSYGGSGSLGDFVWWDVDTDGVQDVGEPGIAGVDIEIRWAGPNGTFDDADDVTWAVTTDGAGAYGQDMLPAGDFRVTVDDSAVGSLPNIGVPTYDLDGTGTANVATLTLGDSETNLDADFGYAGTASIGDTVWFDVDDSGTQNGDEPGLDAVAVDLVWAGLDQVLGTADDLSISTVTSGGGDYLFGDLFPGDHTVTVDEAGIPTGLAAAYDLDGGNDSTTSVDLPLGTALDTVDFGYRGDATLGDLVFLDVDLDFTQDPTDPGIADVDMLITWPGPDGSLDTPDDTVFTVTTDADGLWTLSGLPGGLTYRVEVDETTLPPGVSQTFDPDGPPPLPRDGQTEVDLSAGEVYLDADFGYGGDQTVGDLVWLDLDSSGTADAGEPGIPNVEIRVTWAGVDDILDTGDDVTVTTFTDADGLWQVTGAAAGSTRVEVVTLPPGLAPTYDFDGIATPNVSEFVTASGSDNLDQDFGYVGANSLGDFVWFDADGDGVQDTGEPGIPAVEVGVIWTAPANGPLPAVQVTLPAATTDADGLWTVTGLPEGDFLVVVGAGIPAGVVPSFDIQGPVDGIAAVALGVGESRDDVDFGYYGTATAGDFVWWDLNGDGAQDPDEPGFPGVGVTVTWDGFDGSPGTADDVVYLLTTDADGAWLASNLAPGSFEVVIATADLPAGLTPTYDPDGGSDSLAAFTLAPLETNLSLDFGYTGERVIGDLVWRDVLPDGIRTLDEPPLDGIGVDVIYLGADGAVGGGDDVTIALVTSAGPNPPTTSGGFGGAAEPGEPYYLATGLVEGTYLVTIDIATLPADATVIADLDGGDPTQTTVVLTGGLDELDADFAVFINDPPEVTPSETIAACGADVLVDPLAGVTDPNGDDVVLDPDSIVAPEGVTVTIEGSLLRISTGSSVTDDYVVTWDVVDENGGRATVTLTVVVDCIDVDLGDACSVNDAAILTWSIVGTGAPAEAPVTIRWYDSDGTLRVTQTDQTLNGTTLWPGFSPDGSFDEDFAWIIEGASVTFETANGPVVGPYPLEYPCETLPVTGFELMPVLTLGMILVTLGGAILFASRRKPGVA